MSEKVITIEEKETEKDCNNIPESETKADTNTNKTKILSLKKIEFIILFIIILLGLFFFASYLSPSKKSQKNINIANEQLIEGLRKTDIIRERDDQVIKEQVRNEDRDLIKQQLIKDPDIIKPAIKNVTNEPSVIVKPVITNSYEKKVLLITNHFSKTKNDQQNISPDVLYNLLSQIKTVKLTVLDAYDSNLDNKTLSYLKNFDLVVLDFVDAGFALADRCKKFTRNLMQYINEGGALFSGHDQFDNTHKAYIAQEAVDMLSLLGFIHQNGWGAGSGYFEKSAIKNSIFLVNHALYGDSIPISYTHQTYSKYNTSCKTCNVILKFVKNDGDTYEYLVTNRPNKGKTVNVRAGHSSSFTEAEKKIFLSSILWLLYEI